MLETLTKHNKPKLYGVALKPEPENLSEYCKIGASDVFLDLCENLSYISKFLVVTYNNTSNANARSNTKISLDSITNILNNFGETKLYNFPYKAFNSGKTDFKNHAEYIFVCKINK